MHAKLLQSTPWSVACKAPLLMGLPRQEYCHFLLQGISLTQEEELNVSYQWKLVETSGNSGFTLSLVLLKLMHNCFYKVKCEYLVKMGFPGGIRGKEPTCQRRRQERCRFDPCMQGSGRSPGAANGYPLQCSCLGNPMDRRAWWGYSLQGCTESDTT